MVVDGIPGERKMMEPAEIAQFARNLSVMVRVQGPDPKGLKMRRRAFHLHQSGRTTLSASGLLLPPGSLAETPPIIDHVCEIHKHAGAVVVTCASVIEPFLITEQRNDPRQLFSPKLIHDAHIDVLFEGGEKGGDGVAGPCWVPVQLLAVVDVPASSAALRSLIGGQSGSLGNPSWEVGWSLAPVIDDHNSEAPKRQVGNDIGFTFESRRNFASEDSSNSTHMAQPATRIAFLGVSSLDVKVMLNIEVSQPLKNGDLLLIIGSPFGILSHFHFFNSVSVGAVANCCSQDSHHCSLMMADVRCLPGMEGGPVFDKHGCLTGILMRPLKQKGGNAEIQLVVTWDAIATVWGERPHKEVQRPNRNLIYKDMGSVSSSPGSPSMSQLSLEKTLPSIVLVTVDGGAWASGVLLNDQGLILTNAHLLEPWRFDKTSLLGQNKTTTSSTECKINPFKQEGNHSLWRNMLPSQLENSNAMVDDERTASLLNLSRKSYNIAVRLDDKKRQIWSSARVVYVSRGPFDVALLQLESLPFQLRAITPEFAHPTAGINVRVIGHGLFGPRSVLGPSVSSGVLANVVRLPAPLHKSNSTSVENKENLVPVMLQTTAAVHPGASGGAVVNSDGRMIGLVTSNAKHGGGAIIPNMNFSISSAALKPIFEFAEKQDMLILHVLDKPNELLTAVWALTPPSSTRQQPFIDNKEGRGSRFARFLSERQTDFSSLKIGDNVIEKPSDLFRRSKM
ncbi:Peptidase Do protein [Dioscorea alata]|uniref:Peptidase Do protein n=1 Tax=Dioscorea alata TaxID=55571 RepID=A0ACB7UNG2_DIOAL|nr:Peptidase Do protein [Dioscorea alata]